MSSFRTLLLAAVAVVTSGSAYASVIMYSGTPGMAVSLRPTSFVAGTGVTIPKFDTALGTLTGISFVLSGTVVADVKFENRSSQAQVVSANVTATETLTRPDLTVLVSNLPVAATTVSETAFDGVFNYLGTSGTTLTGVTGTLSTASGLLTGATDLATFSQAGGGSVFLPVGAKAVSAVSGSTGGRVTYVSTVQASAQVLVQYTYTDPPPVTVPEPATLAILGAGLLALGAANRRKS